LIIQDIFIFTANTSLVRQLVFNHAVLKTSYLHTHPQQVLPGVALHKRAYATHLMWVSKKGISARQMERSSA
jgi:hypothetical protein